MAVTQVIGPHREHEDQALAVEVPREEGHEIARRSIDPVEVFEDDDDRRVGGEVAEQPQEQAEQARLAEAAARIGRLLRCGGVRPGCSRGGATMAAPRGIADARQEPSDLFSSGSQDLVDPLRGKVAQVATQRLGERAVGHAPVGEIETAAL
jgi:hypothetical protein